MTTALEEVGPREREKKNSADRGPGKARKYKANMGQGSCFLTQVPQRLCQ
jgi:hypothetical protein